MRRSLGSQEWGSLLLWGGGGSGFYFYTNRGGSYEDDGITIIQAESDADTLIVSTVLRKAMEGASVSLYGIDTHLSIMLLHHWNESYGEIYMKYDTTRKGRKH